MSDPITPAERTMIAAWLAEHKPTPLAPGATADPAGNTSAGNTSEGDRDTADWNGYRLARERIVAAHRQRAERHRQYLARAKRESQSLQVHERATRQAALAALKHAGLTR